MKKIIYSSLIFVGLIANSCQKDEILIEEQNHSTQNDVLSNDQISIIENLEEQINSVSIEKNSSILINPENINNPYDSYGQYMNSFMSYMNNSEIETPSENEEQYLSKAENYYNNTPYGVNFSEISIKPRIFFNKLSDLTINASLIKNTRIAVASLKVIENTIVKTPLSKFLTSDEQKLLLNFTAMMKYARTSIEENGVTVEGKAIGGGPCFDYYFDRGAFYVFSSLTDTDNPPVLVGAWVGLPGTIVTAIINGLYQAFVHC